MRGKILVLVVMLTSFFILPFVLAEPIDTELNVPDSPPYFEGIIPDFSWEGDAFVDAFNMNDYFFDLQGDELLFSYSSVTNLAITISPEGSVSFYPDSGYIGTKTVIFYASDSIGNASSNPVKLDIGVDTEAPKWSNPKISRQSVYQNDYLDFIATWTDNFELKNYYTSVNQGGIWLNYTDSFSGKIANSSSSVKISAAYGESIIWKVCAYDTSNNFDCTDEYEITVLKRPIIEGGDAGTSDGSGVEGEGTVGDTITENLKYLYDELVDLLGIGSVDEFVSSVDSFFVTLKQGTSKSQIFEIANVGDDALNFSLYLEGVSELTTISDKNFELKKDENKIITIEFEAKLNTLPGQYFGNLVVQSSKTLVIPIMINVNNLNLDYEVLVEIIEGSENVKPGDQALANITINNIGEEVLADVSFQYAIKDFSGNIYESAEDEFSIAKTITFVKNLTIPESTPLGRYVFYGRVFNEKDSAIDSDSFVVGQPFMFAAILKISSTFLIIILLSFFSIILLTRHRKQKKKEQILNLYVRLNELKEYVKEGKFDMAVKSYIAIKTFYGEAIPEDMLENKENLKKEMKKLAGKIIFEEEEKEPAESETTDDIKDESSSESTDEEKNKENEGDKKSSEKKNEEKSVDVEIVNNESQSVDKAKDKKEVEGPKPEDKIENIKNKNPKEEIIEKENEIEKENKNKDKDGTDNKKMESEKSE